MALQTLSKALAIGHHRPHSIAIHSQSIRNPFAIHSQSILTFSWMALQRALRLASSPDRHEVSWPLHLEKPTMTCSHTEVPGKQQALGRQALGRQAAGTRQALSRLTGAGSEQLTRSPSSPCALSGTVGSARARRARRGRRAHRSSETSRRPS